MTNSRKILTVKNMNALFTTLTILVVIASILVTIVVLLQNGKGGGLASNFAAGNQTFGVRQTADILEKFTWGLAAAILVISIAASFSTSGSGKNELDITNKIENAAPEQVPDFAPVEVPAENAE